MNLERVIAVRNNKTVYRSGDKCIKVFSANFSKADVLNEALNQARIEEADLNIPRVLEVAVVDGQWAIVSEFIQGKTLAQLMKENPENFNDYLEFFIDLQMKVHACTAPMLNSLTEKLSRKIRQSNLSATTRIDLHHRLENLPQQNHVCHGDFNPSNIVITEDGTPYILDWSHATQGNVCADVARTYLYLLFSGETETATQYLERFCEKSNTDPRDVQKWIPIVAASQSVKSNTLEREFLLSSITLSILRKERSL